MRGIWQNASPLNVMDNRPVLCWGGICPVPLNQGLRVFMFQSGGPKVKASVRVSSTMIKSDIIGTDERSCCRCLLSAVLTYGYARHRSEQAVD